jgi:hypothetical protein
MGKPSKALLQFMEKYGVNHDECWEVRAGGAWAVKHAAIERIAAEQKITFELPREIEISSMEKFAVILVVGRMGDRVEWSYGEASPTNNKNAYVFAMAEKRGKDRVALKLLNAHGTVYSEDEFDERPRPNPHVTRPEDISDGKPNGEIPHVEGVDARPKAKSRETYAELEAEMIRMETLPGLLAWGKTIAATVATMHPDFQDTFRRRFSEYRDELKAMAEAAE